MPLASVVLSLSTSQASHWLWVALRAEGPSVGLPCICVLPPPPGFSFLLLLDSLYVAKGESVLILAVTPEAFESLLCILYFL